MQYIAYYIKSWFEKCHKESCTSATHRADCRPKIRVRAKSELAYWKLGQIHVFWQKPLSAAPLSYRKPIALIERISAAHLNHVIQRWRRQCPQQPESDWELSGWKLQDFVNMSMDNLDFPSYNIVIKYCSLYFTCLFDFSAALLQHHYNLEADNVVRLFTPLGLFVL